MHRNFTNHLMVGIVFAAILSSFAFSQQAKQRSVQFKSYADQPVEITDVKLNGLSVRPKQKIEANSDWLNGMTVTLKNVSDRPVAYISVLVSAYFEKDGSRIKLNGNETQTGVELRYGIQPARPNEPNFSLGQVVLPGETVSVELTKELRDEFTTRLSESSVERFKGASSDISEIIIRVYTIFFEGDSDTMWNTGRWLRRDLKNPRLWTPLPSSNLQIRKTPKLKVTSTKSSDFQSLSPEPDPEANFCTLRDGGREEIDCTGTDTGGYRCRRWNVLLYTTGSKNVLPESYSSCCFGSIPNVTACTVN